MSVRVKICGLTTLEDALMAAHAGADLLGFNFYPKSPRYIDIESARTLCGELRETLASDCPTLVGLFVNEPVGKISITMERVGLRFVQLSGDESVDMLRELRGTAYKAIRPKSISEAQEDAAYFEPAMSDDERIPSLLVDAFNPALYGGTGEQASRAVLKAVVACAPRVMAAGGLTPDNVAQVIENVFPWGVDVASGVEMEGQPGRKDPDKVERFIMSVRQSEMSSK